MQEAARRAPRLPFPAADILLIDEIGKEISGTGMDTNVIGRKYHDHSPAEHETPKIKRVLVRGLSAKTQGNAAGIGLAEFCLSRVVEQMDTAATWMNCLTANHAAGGMLPIHFPTDRELLAAAWPTLGLIDPSRPACCGSRTRRS